MWIRRYHQLEFLLAEAQAAGCDSVITVGGVQSNHCRATAAAVTAVGETVILLMFSLPMAIETPGGWAVQQDDSLADG